MRFKNKINTIILNTHTDILKTFKDQDITNFYNYFFYLSFIIKIIGQYKKYNSNSFKLQKTYIISIKQNQYLII